MSFILNTPILDMSSAEYHATEGTFSSSQLKTLLEDPELFYKKYISKEIERQSNDSFDIGTYYHTGVLEPHKLKSECVVFPGKIKSGGKWEAFQKKHKGKAILKSTDVEIARRLIANTKASPIAMSYVKRGTPEVSMFVEIGVSLKERKIFAPTQELVLSLEKGWLQYRGKFPKDMVLITLKVRADSIGLKHDFVLDLKSTTMNAKDEREMKNTISSYMYDLSCALYLDIFSAGMEKEFGKFIWTFASKKYDNCKSWKASAKQKLVGRAKWMRAVFKLAEGIACDWKFGDTLGILEPNYYEESWLFSEDEATEEEPEETDSCPEAEDEDEDYDL